jgi:HlyD family secretion protein
MLSQSELDSAVANRDTLAAQVKVAQAAVEQARASLRVSKANLDYTTIRSPVSGVVIARNVSEGQTVVASLSAQVLFTIATDLRQVQVEASIPEADIGRIRVGQPVAFTVDAYEQVFTGRVEQVRLAAATVQNVVTYPVVVRAENPEGRLFPGMTANIVCEVARREGALKVPNAALRFKPEEAAEAGGGPPRESRTAAAGPHVWVPEGKEGRPRPVAIGTGISDGSFTEVREPSGVSAGQAVITGRLAKGERASDPVNPFTPRFPREARRAAR